jgi:hypothetical protein
MSSPVEQFRLLTRLKPSDCPYTVFAYILASELYQDPITLDSSRSIGYLLSLGSFSNLDAAAEKISSCMEVVECIHIFYMYDGEVFPLQLYPERRQTLSLSQEAWKNVGSSLVKAFNRNLASMQDNTTYSSSNKSEDPDFLKNNFYYLTLHAKQRGQYRQALEKLDAEVNSRAANCIQALEQYKNLEQIQSELTELKNQYSRDLEPHGEMERLHELQAYLNNLDTKGIPRVISDNVTQSKESEERSKLPEVNTSVAPCTESTQSSKSVETCPPASSIVPSVEKMSAQISEASKNQEYRPSLDRSQGEQKTKELPSSSQQKPQNRIPPPRKPPKKLIRTPPPSSIKKQQKKNTSNSSAEESVNSVFLVPEAKNER